MKVALVLLLVAPAASLHVHSAEGACSCITWKNAYTDHNVKCGQGYELGVVGRTRLSRESLPPTSGAESYVYPEFCGFYQASSINGCLNKRYGTPSEQWCYVSAECQVGTEKVEGTAVAIKSCSTADNLMNSTDPVDLNGMALVDNQQPGLLDKLAYATAPEKWSDIEGASGLKDEVLKRSHFWDCQECETYVQHKATPSATQKLQEYRASDIPTIFDADGGHGGGTLVWGPKIYISVPLPGKFPGYKCVQGCSDSLQYQADA